MTNYFVSLALVWFGLIGAFIVLAVLLSYATYLLFGGA